MAPDPAYTDAKVEARRRAVLEDLRPPSDDFKLHLSNFQEQQARARAKQPWLRYLVLHRGALANSVFRFTNGDQVRTVIFTYGQRSPHLAYFLGLVECDAVLLEWVPGTWACSDEAGFPAEATIELLTDVVFLEGAKL
eukprot:3209764-Alexandrium_andersonii.AAC.1